ncbi:MAG: flagellar hook-length control protein FliK [bacterium]
MNTLTPPTQAPHAPDLLAMMPSHATAPSRGGGPAFAAHLDAAQTRMDAAEAQPAQGCPAPRLMPSHDAVDPRPQSSPRPEAPAPSVHDREPQPHPSQHATTPAAPHEPHDAPSAKPVREDAVDEAIVAVVLHASAVAAEAPKPEPTVPATGGGAEFTNPMGKTARHPVQQVSPEQTPLPEATTGVPVIPVGMPVTGTSATISVRPPLVAQPSPASSDAFPISPSATRPSADARTGMPSTNGASNASTAPATNPIRPLEQPAPVVHLLDAIPVSTTSETPMASTNPLPALTPKVTVTPPSTEQAPVILQAAPAPSAPTGVSAHITTPSAVAAIPSGAQSEFSNGGGQFQQSNGQGGDRLPQPGITLSEVVTGAAVGTSSSIGEPSAPATLGLAGSLREVAAQLAMQMSRERVPQGMTRLRFTVTPPELGSITIELSRSGDRLTSRLIARTMEAHGLLERLLPELKQQLTDRGYQVRELALSYQGGSDSAGQSLLNGGRHGTPAPEPPPTWWSSEANASPEEQGSTQGPVMDDLSHVLNLTV